MIETIALKIGKSILSKLIWIGIGVLLTLLLFATICKSKPQTVTAEIPLQVIETIISSMNTVQEILDSDNWPKGYVIKTKYETVYVDSATPYGDVPVTETSWDSIFTLLLNQQKKSAKIGFAVTTKGELLKHRITFFPTTFTVDVPSESALRVWGNLGLGYTTDNKVPGCAELGLLFKKRVSLSEQVIHIDDWYWITWAKAWF